MTQYGRLRLLLFVKSCKSMQLGQCGPSSSTLILIVTVGERIDNTLLTYGHGASVELVTVASVYLADRFDCRCP